MSISWGGIVGSYGRIGIETSVSITDNTTVTVTANIYFWSKYSVSDTSNTLYFDYNTTSATTSKGSKSIKTTSDSGGWSTSNQKIIGTYTFTRSRGKGSSTQSCAAKLTGVERVGGTMTVTATYDIPSKPSYTVSYNLNGGSGTSSTQTKWHDENLTLHPAPSRSGWTFVGWGTSTSDTSKDYNAGATYSTNASIPLYAIWSKVIKVSYDPNGGSGDPSDSSETVYNGNNRSYTIPASTKPSKTNYDFLGWSTSSSTTTPDSRYDPGDTVSLSSSITLYAVWKLAYRNPTITYMKASRCDLDGTDNEFGLYCKLNINWKCDQTVGTNPIKSLTYTFGNNSPESISVDTTAISGSASVIAPFVTTIEQVYSIQATLTDSKNGTHTVSTSLLAAKFIMDIKAGGTGIAFGKPATDDDYVDFGFNVKGRVFGLGKLPGIPSNSDFNDYVEPGIYAVGGNAVAKTISNIPCQLGGRLIVSASLGEYNPNNIAWIYISQTYIPYQSSYGQYARSMEIADDGVWQYGAWYKTTVTKV